MEKRDRSSKNLFILGTLITSLILVYISTVWLLPTLTRYIYREQDEIKAYYTALYFASNGDGKTIAMENNEGYVEFDLRNYIDENVTQRNIVYHISKPTEYYDKYGKPIDNVEKHLEDPNNQLYVLDVWKNPKLISRSTYYYNVSIEKNTGEEAPEDMIGNESKTLKHYLFRYEKLGTSAVGKTHTVTCKIESTRDNELQEDTISLVVQLTYPYKEVLIINMKVSNRLVTFAHGETTLFDINFDQLYIQSSDLYANYKNDQNTIRTAYVDNDTHYEYTPYAFKLTITWSGYVLDEENLEGIHLGTSSSLGADKYSDSLSNNDQRSEIYPNPEGDKPYIDIDKSTIVKIDSDYSTETGHTGELIIFIPQSTDICLLFLKTATKGTVDVKVEAYVKLVDNNTTTEGYELYEQNIFGGYVHTDGKYNLFSYEN